MWIINTVKQLFKKNGFKVISKKILIRLRSKGFDNVDVKWLEDNSTSFVEYIKSLDPILYNETLDIVDNLTQENSKTLDKLDVKLGGSANLHLLYFLVRKFKPNTIVETGVAAGHSSRAILHAIRYNKTGKLFSSDFPYFRIKDPEKYIGILVEDELRINWSLRIEGDKINISKFLDVIEKIDLFHYDSDKSYYGKKRTFNQIKNKIKSGSILIFDDIQDDNFFKEISIKHNFDFKVFNYNTKYIGLITL